MTSSLDATDRALLEALSENSRASWRDLAAQIGVSPPTVRDRIRRLEDIGVIRGYSLDLDPAALGYPIEAIIRLRPLAGKLHILDRLLQEAGQVVQCDKVTGEDCYVARVRLREIAELDGFLEIFAGKADTHTAIVKTTSVKPRYPDF